MITGSHPVERSSPEELLRGVAADGCSLSAAVGSLVPPDDIQRPHHLVERSAQC